MAPQILMLDGKEINKSERILANQKLEDLKLELLTEIELQKIKIKNKQTGYLKNTIKSFSLCIFFCIFLNKFLS